jgi:hypothetical protein
MPTGELARRSLMPLPAGQIEYPLEIERTVNAFASQSCVED